MVSLDEQIGAVEACLSVAELAECLHESRKITVLTAFRSLMWQSLKNARLFF